jgi:glutamyl-tRNA reductase
MSLIALGINHKSADVAFRERVAFAPQTMPEALAALSEAAGLEQLVILSTCNRTEIFAICSRDRESVFVRLVDFLSSYHHVELSELHNSYYCYREERALRHLIEVSSGLDSMVLGETQIFGQIKSALAVAAEEGFVGVELKRVFSHAFSIARQVRTDTAIGKNPVSVASAAVGLGRKLLSNITSKRALLLGAGETIELVAKYLHELQGMQLIIANRTLSQACKLADRFDAQTILFSQVPEYLAQADLVISATASQLPIVGKGAIEQALHKKQGGMLLIDLAVPRDIEPQVAELEGVDLYTIDDLAGIVEENKQSRQTEVSKADVIIEQGIDAFLQQLQSKDAVSTVKAYRDKALGIRDSELNKAISQLKKGKNPEQVLEQLARNLTNKLIHSPSAQLKKSVAFGREEMLLLTKELFELADKSDNE